MNLRRYIPICVAVPLLAGVAWWVARPLDEPVTSPGQNLSPEPTAGVASAADALASPGALPAREDLPGRALSIISQPDEGQRIREFCELLRSIDRDNGGTVAEALARQRKREGKMRLTEEQLLEKRRTQLTDGIEIPFASLPPESAGLTAAFRAAAANPDEIARTQLYCEVAARIHAENWREALPFLKQTITGGYALNPYWSDSIVHTQIVRVAGSAAIEEMEGVIGDRSAALRLLGKWSRVDPAKTEAWLASVPQDDFRKRRYYFAGWGMSSVDPERGWRLMAEAGEHLDSRAVRGMVEDVGDDFGWSAAERLYATIRQDAGSSNATVKTALGALAKSRVAMLSGGTTEEAQMTLDWLALQPPEHYGAAYQFISATTAIDAQRTMQWLDRRADAIPPKIVTYLYATVVRAWTRTDMDSITTWIRENRGHPQYELIAKEAGVR